MKPANSLWKFRAAGHLLVTGAVLLMAQQASGQGWIHIPASSDSGTLDGTTNLAEVADVELERGPHLVGLDLFPGYWDSRNWSTAGAFPGSGSGSYFALRFEVQAGYQFTPQSLAFHYEDGGDGNGPVRVELHSSADNFANILFSDVNAHDSNVETVTAGQLGSTPLTGTAEFRWYGYGAGNANGVLGLVDDPTLIAGGNAGAVLLEGDISPIPEPAGSALVLALGGFIVLKRLRKTVYGT